MILSFLWLNFVFRMLICWWMFLILVLIFIKESIFEKSFKSHFEFPLLDSPWIQLLDNLLDPKMRAFLLLCLVILMRIALLKVFGRVSMQDRPENFLSEKPSPCAPKQEFVLLPPVMIVGAPWEVLAQVQASAHYIRYLLWNLQQLCSCLRTAGLTEFRF